MLVVSSMMNGEWCLVKTCNNSDEIKFKKKIIK